MNASAPARRFAPLLDFLRSETAGGAALVAASVLALVLSNSPVAPWFGELTSTVAGAGPAWVHLRMPLVGWVNNGLMALFFLTVGLEIRREMTEGILAARAQIAAPALAALGGMVVPALIYVAFNHGDAARLHGWAVPVATDIAFVLAASAVLGRRMPIGLKIFLAALSILDDLGAIAVIGVFYTRTLDGAALAEAAAIWAILYGLRRAGVRVLAPYLVGGLLAWWCVLRSGIHPTLAGVVLAFLVPKGDESGSPADRLEHGLGTWVTWCVLPLFGLMNAGLQFSGLTPGMLAGPLVLGTALGLLVGKPVGVLTAILAARRIGVARLPAGLTAQQLCGGAMLCGIGFTMSLFIGDLSFQGTSLLPQLKLAVLAGSVLAAAGGLVVLALAPPMAKPT